jgi:hypothetical protein
LLTLALCACSSEESEPPPVPLTCSPLEIAAPDGSCVRPGVPPTGCAEGFVHDGEYTCEPRLPVAACSPGEIAIPGDDACRPVMPCGGGTWGDIPVEPGAHYVDASYTGVDSDGTQQRPWTRIQQALEAVPTGTLVAIARGTYAEDIWLWDKSARIWGVCPAEVEIVGTGAEASTVLVGHAGASASELHGVAVTGPNAGVAVSGVAGVWLDRLWVHDTGNQGLAVQTDYGATSMRVTDSLFEQCRELGVHVSATQVSIEKSVVRGTQPSAAQLGGRGIEVDDCWPQTGCASIIRGSLSLSESVVEQNHEIGIFVAGSDAMVDGAVVRSTLPQPADGTGGGGIYVQISCLPGFCEPTARSTLTLRRSVLDQNQEIGLSLIGADMTVESTVVRNVAPRGIDQVLGRGITIQDCDAAVGCASPVAAAATITSSLVAGSYDVGTWVFGSSLEMNLTVVRDTLPQQIDGRFGDGIAVFTQLTLPSSALLSGVLVERSARAGIANFASSIALGTTAIRCAAFDLEGETLEVPFSFEDRGGNRCGCPQESGDCVAVSAGLEPPAQFSPAP